LARRQGRAGSCAAIARSSSAYYRALAADRGAGGCTAVIADDAAELTAHEVDRSAGTHDAAAGDVDAGSRSGYLAVTG
jgi:hypothetical protein